MLLQRQENKLYKQTKCLKKINQDKKYKKNEKMRNWATAELAFLQ